MNTDRDHLDDAIDHVATRMTRIEDHDAALAARIVASLPERITWFGWLSQSWALRFATIAIVVSAGWLVLGRDSVSQGPEKIVATGPARPAELVEPAEGVEPVGSVSRVEPLEPVERVEPLEPADHEYSLPAIEAVAALSLDSLGPESLPEDAPLTVAPLAIADLPLTAEGNSQR